MLDGRPAKPLDADAAQERVKCGEILRGSCSPVTAVGSLGLILAIALWTFSYKLSRFDYSLGGTLAHVPMARLWIEQRFGTAGIATTAKVVPPNSPGADVLVAKSPVHSFDCVPAASASAVRPHAIPFFQSAIPLRSPPVVSL